VSIKELFEGVELIGIIGFGSVFLSLILIVILAVYIHIMYLFLSKRLDASLFQSPWFSDAELIMYSSWPLSMLRIFYYMYFITFPKYLGRKRFKGVNSPLPLSPILIIASKIYMALHLLFAITGITFFVVGGYVYFFV